MKQQPDYTSGAVQALQEAAKLPETIYAGTKAMRDAGAQYLPKFEEEDGSAYSARINSSFLYNAFKLAVGNLRGKVFRKKARILDVPDDGPEREWEQDWDNQGSSLTKYAQDVFRGGTVSGLKLNVSDWPKGTGELDRGAEMEAGVRPYATMISLADLRSLDFETLNGRRRIVRLRWYVKDVELLADGGEECVEKIMMLMPGYPGEESPRPYATFQFWMRRGEGRDRKWMGPSPEMQLKPHVDVPVDIYNPLTDFEPPLLDLAWTNLEHWQSSSDQRNILHFVRIPILFASGMADSEKDDIESIGAGLLISSKEPTAKLSYVEHTGKAVDTGWVDLKRLVDQMTVQALRPMTDKPQGNETATAKIIGEAQADSQLEAYALTLGEVLTSQLHRMQIWANMEPRGRVEINTDFGLTQQDVSDLNRLEDARDRGDISRETYLERLAEARVLPDGWTKELEMDRLDQEGPDKVGLGSYPKAAGFNSSARHQPFPEAQ